MEFTIGSDNEEQQKQEVEKFGGVCHDFAEIVAPKVRPSTN